MAIGMRVKRWLEPKLAYTAWAKGGSLGKARFVLKDEFDSYNKVTGKVFTTQAIWNSSTYFILNNQREAREIYDGVMRANGVLSNDLSWYEFLVPKILKLSPRNFKEFMASNSHLQPFIDNYVKSKK